jgi:uncharacterized protein YjbJ (UPF0337 family)
MQELITRLTQQAGITPDQAAKAIEAVKDFVKEKFPMMSGAVDNLLATNSGTTNPTAFPEAPLDPTVPVPENPGILDKISDFIPGETGQKVEDFTKKAAGKAEDLYDAAKDKLSGLFGDKK